MLPRTAVAFGAFRSVRDADYPMEISVHALGKMVSSILQIYKYGCYTYLFYIQQSVLRSKEIRIV